METIQTFCFEAAETDADRRLDHYLVDQLPDMRRNQIQRLIREGNVRINGLPALKPAERVQPGNKVELDIPLPEASPIEPEDIPIEFLYQDDDLAVINKPPGLPVHPTPFLLHGTLVHGLLNALDHLSGVGGVMRPGILHRLDKGTSGIMVIAKNDETHVHLSEQFANRSIRKEYLALVTGAPPETSGRVEGPIGRHPSNRKLMAIVDYGRVALTEYKIEKRFKCHTLVRAFPRTGRTHQIRVHLKSLGCPVVGDPAYGYRARTAEDKQIAPLLKEYPGFCLHAAFLGFVHPRTAKPMEFELPPPEGFQAVLKALEQLSKEMC